MKKNIIWNAIGSTISSFISLFLLILVTRINGLENAGIFTYSFSTACLFYTIAVYYGRVYQVTDSGNYEDSDYIYNRITTCIFMLVVSIAFLIIKQYSGYKSTILFLLCFFKCVEAFGECIYAIIQKKDKLSYVGKSMTIKTITSLILFLIIDKITNNLIISITSIILINILLIIFYDKKNMGTIIYKKIDHNKNKKLLKDGFYIFAFSLLSIYVINASKYAIDGRLTEELQGIFGIIIMPATIMSLFSQFIIQPYLVKLKELLNKKDVTGFINMCTKILMAMFIIGIICIGLAYYIGLPLLEIVYSVSLKSYSFEFLIIMIGSLFYGYTVLISFILITLRKTKSQFIILLITSIITLILSNYLVINHALMGASAAYLITMIIEFILYFVIMIYYFRKLRRNKDAF